MAMNSTYNEDYSFNESGVQKKFEEFVATYFKKDHSSYIGKILFAHLICEKLLIDILQSLHPNIGNVGDLQLGFSKILDMVAGYKGNHKLNGEFISALKNLNIIRNKYAHSHKFHEIPQKQIYIIRKFCEKVMKRRLTKVKDIDVIDQFLVTAAGIAHAFIDGTEVIRNLEQELLSLQMAQKRLK